MQLGNYNQSLVCTYEGHTLFSIFFDSIQVYEQVLNQLREMEFEMEEDFNGTDIENSYLRRLYRVLYLPTSDFMASKAKLSEVLRAREEEEELIARPNGCRRFRDWARTKLGLVKNVKKGGDEGFKSIQKKSLHF